jgi:hypothetical protein
MERLKPTVVCLCGSTRFFKEFLELQTKLTLEGFIVLSIGATKENGIQNYTKDEWDAIKIKLDVLHLRKIDMCDIVLVINKENYIGESTRREIEYATSIGKTVKYQYNFDFNKE